MWGRQSRDLRGGKGGRRRDRKRREGEDEGWGGQEKEGPSHVVGPDMN